MHVLAANDEELWIIKRIINENPLKSTQPTHRRIKYNKQLHQINQTRGTWVNCLANLVPKCDTIIDLFNFNSPSLLPFLDAMERIPFDSAEWVICGGVLPPTRIRNFFMCKQCVILFRCLLVYYIQGYVKNDLPGEDLLMCFPLPRLVAVNHIFTFLLLIWHNFNVSIVSFCVLVLPASLWTGN